MVAVQLDEVYRALVSSDVLTVIVGKEYFGDVMDLKREILVREPTAAPGA